MLEKKTLSLALCLASAHLLVAETAIAKEPKNTLPYVTSQPTQVITPVISPKVVDRVNVQTAADFLFWKSDLDGLEYAISGYADNNDSTSFSIQKGNAKKPPFCFAPGVKLLFGLDYKLDGFDTIAIYTGLYSDKKTASANYDSTKGLINELPVFQIIKLQPGATSDFVVATSSLSDATCTWRQQFNVLDLELGRNFFISKNLTIRPQIGMKFSWIEEKFHIHYDFNPSLGSAIGASSRDVFGGTLEQISSTDITLHQRQWGIGTRGGLNAVWHFTKEIGIYGNIAASALWSEFRNHVVEVQEGTATITQTEVSSAFQNTVQNNDGKIFVITPVLELALGFQGMVWFNDETCLFLARIGWEGQIWWDFNQFVLPSDRQHGDLSVQGLTARVGFTY